MSTTNLNIRTDKAVKDQAEAIFNELGLSLTTAVNIFLRTAIRENGIPFELKLDVPNEITAKAIKEGKELLSNPKAPKYTSMEALKDALNKWCVAFNLLINSKKDLKLAKKQGKDLDKLFEVINILANGEKLDTKFKDHDLSGSYKGTRECHIEPDWLLVYEIDNNALVLMLYRLGTYSELFKK